MIDLGPRSVVVDLFFPEHNLVVEIDEASLHRKPRIREADSQRDADLAAAGFTVRRVLDDRDSPAILARVLRAIR